MQFKKGVVLSTLFSLGALLISCTSTGSISLIGIWNKILWFGTLGFLGYTAEPPMAGFMRIMIAVLIFAILFELANLTGFLSRNIAITIALILAIISAIFIPGAVLAGIGAGYATFVALVLVGLPVVGGLYLFFRLPTGTRAQRFIRFVVLLILLAILFQVKAHASALSAMGGMTVAGP